MNMIVIDDPGNNKVQSNSELYNRTIEKRLNSAGNVITVKSRLHHADEKGECIDQPIFRKDPTFREWKEDKE